MTTRTPPIESHSAHSQRLMKHAEEQLASGDRLQASEKAWGAVAHQLKAIAEQRGWRYETHSQVYGIVERLASEQGNGQLKKLFPVAVGLHQNFYADVIPLRQLKYEIGVAKELLDMLKRAEL